MSWRRTDPVSERARFVKLWAEGHSISGLCRDFGVSRKTGHKWLKRYRERGEEGLEDLDRAPHDPQRIASEIEEVIVWARESHPTWGPRKLLAWLRRKKGPEGWPAASTVGEILRRKGLAQGRRRRPFGAGARHPGTVGSRANRVWTGDYKGQFRTGDGEMCYPLTVKDVFTRYFLECSALTGTSVAEARPVFERVFREFGLPDVFRSDNGAPFASSGLTKLTALSVWWIRLGIRPETTRRRHPEDNGSHEQTHRILKAQTARPPAWDRSEQQRRFDEFRLEYNEERPHEGIGNRCPEELYQPSPRRYPEYLPEPDYPGHYEVRQVQTSGQISWKGKMIFISEALAQQRVGLTEIEEGTWRVYFGMVEVGVMDEKLANRRDKVLPMFPV